MMMDMTMTMLQNASEVAAAQAAQARGAAEQARDIARAQRDAAQAQRDAAQAQREAAQAAQGGDGTGRVTITKDGKTVVLDGASPEAVSAALGIPSLPPQLPESDGPFVVGGLAIVSTAMVLIYGLTLRYRAKVRGGVPSALPADLTQRLSRMEAGIESVAVEVERISEGQRFTTRLLADRAPLEVRHD